MADLLPEKTLLEKTGRSWKEWVEVIGSAENGVWDHKTLVTYLRQTQGLTHWWAQTVTVGYEKLTGRRITGETADVGFQVGIQRTFSVSLPEAWKLIASTKGLSILIDDCHGREIRQGEKFETDDSSTVEIRVLQENHHIRMNWTPPGWKMATVLQVRVLEKGEGKVGISIHHEKLPDHQTREIMRERWKQALSRLGDAFQQSS